MTAALGRASSPTDKIEHSHEILHISEASCPMVDQAYHRVESLQQGIDLS
jgi:hypothetical protein